MRSATLAVIIWLGAGCTSVIPAQRSTDLAPKPVTTSLPIGVNPLLFNLEPGQVVGGVAAEPDGIYDEVFLWNENFKLRRHAFQNPARAELKANGFVFGIGSKAAYQLKSTIEHMVFNQYPNHAEAEVRVQWTFEGPNRLELRTEGYARVDETGTEALYHAYRTSLRNLLARDDILARFAPKGLPVVPPTGEPDSPEAPPDPPRPVAVDRPVDRVSPSSDELTNEELDVRVRQGVVTLLARDRWSSGVVVRDDGLVITSAFLVAGVSYVNLVLADGTTRAAKVLLVDKEAGLALVKSVSSGRYVAQSVNLATPKKGAGVSAYGTPFHPALSVSTARGTIAASGPTLTTDVKVNAGNAGGPLVDRNGNVVGIITWRAKRTADAATARAVPMKTVFESLRLSFD